MLGAWGSQALVHLPEGLTHDTWYGPNNRFGMMLRRCIAKLRSKCNLTDIFWASMEYQGNLLRKEGLANSTETIVLVNIVRTRYVSIFGDAYLAIRIPNSVVFENFENSVVYLPFRILKFQYYYFAPHVIGRPPFTFSRCAFWTPRKWRLHQFALPQLVSWRSDSCIWGRQTSQAIQRTPRRGCDRYGLEMAI